MRIFNWLIRLTDALSGRPRRRRSLCMSSAEQFETRAMLSAFFVTTPVDAVDVLPGDGLALTSSGETSLRSAVEEANALPGADSIQLPDGIFALELLEGWSGDGANGSLAIKDDLTIRGAGPDHTTIDATHIDRMFELFGRAQLELLDLTIRVRDIFKVVNNSDGLAPFRNVAIVERQDLEVVAIEPTETQVIQVTAANAESDEPVDAEPVNTEHVNSELVNSEPVNAEPKESLAFPLRQFEPLSSNPRQLELVRVLAQTYLPQNEPWQRTHQQRVATELNRLDATLGISSGFSRDVVEQPDAPLRVADNDPNRPGVRPLRPLPNVDSQDRTDSKANPHDTAAKRRADVVNSLFEKDGNAKGRVNPAGAESNPMSTSGNDRTGSTPALLPQSDRPTQAPESKPKTDFPIFENDRPAPPPLPEVRVDNQPNVTSHRNESRGTAMTAGVLMALVRPRSGNRKTRKTASGR